MDEEEIKYQYSTDELDAIIEKINKGLQPMISDEMMLEVKLRYKELQHDLFDEDDDELTDISEIKRHNEMMKSHIEKKKREASKKDVLVLTISEDVKKQIRENMEVSIVRSNPNSDYNKTDEELYTSAEAKRVYQRLSRIKSCFYNSNDYKNAMAVIGDAITYSLKNDYPWMSYEEALNKFNSGAIKLNIPRPKLYINYTTQITDVSILKGIVDGSIELRDSDKSADRKTHKKKDFKPVYVDYNVIGKEECKAMALAHSKGYDTPISACIKHKSGIYNRFSLPSSSIFSYNNEENKDNTPTLFDWSVEGAGERYFNLIHNKRYNVSDLVKSVNEDNGGALNNVVLTNMTSFMNSINKTAPNYKNNFDTTVPIVSTSLRVNPEAARVEANILAAMRANNPTK